MDVKTMKNTNSKARDTDLRKYGPTSSRITDRYISLSSGVELRVISYYQDESKHLPIVMVTGLASVMESSREITRALTGEFTLHYLETREKSSSRTNSTRDFSVDSIGKDIVQVISKLGLKNDGYILFGASLAATAMVNSYRHLEHYPKTLILLEPNASFNVPRWSIPLIHISSSIYWAIKPVAKFYIRNFRINRQEDYEMYKISARALDAADPYKLKKTVLSMARYKIWEYLKTVDTPTLIVGASKDHFHNHEEMVKMADLLQDCTFVDLETHERTHSMEFLDVLKQHIQKV